MFHQLFRRRDEGSSVGMRWKRFRVMLKHVDSGKNLTKWEQIQRGIKRGQRRLQRLSVMFSTAISSSSVVKAPVAAGNGEFLMYLSIGTPPKSYSAVMDTGSDLVWTQCKPCSQCFKQSTPIFNPKLSSTFSKLSCSSHICVALPKPTCGDRCEYVYSYGDYSSTQGVMATETFTFGKVSVPNIGFGCGEENDGEGFSQGAGLVGLGRGPLSLVSQLKEPNVNRTFGAIKTTPLIHNALQPSFYYLSLQGITVGRTRLPFNESTFTFQDDGSGGLIIDSGTTITYLEESVFNVLSERFIKQMKLPVDNSGSTGLELCFILPSDTSKVKVPKLIFHFDGADLDLPGENYVIADSNMGLICLAMGRSNGISILGNIQQQNILVLHDLKKKTLSFVQTQCHKL
ncbi:hypothetical protein GOBAR_AA06875 [Gossypium barbadense]|uniref:nepenthesin n=1 Tax=Gossypium barbadense TaxID=3634 RepID=A0A2P5YDI8_GOSBA|nr:hypothetical protein GOBAR_AA06875 [Gossypium barbadense]